MYFNMKLLFSSYLERRDEFNKSLEKSPEKTLQTKLIQNLIVTDLLLDNLTSLLCSIKEHFDTHISPETREYSNQVNEIKDELDNLKDEVSNVESLTDIQKKLLIQNLTNKQIQLSGGAHLSEIRKLYTEILVACISETIISAEQIFHNRDIEYERSALQKLFKFIATLNPFVAGADTAYQILKAREIAFNSTNDYVKGLNNYWSICFCHATSTIYLDEIIKSMNESDGVANIQINDCVKLAERKFLKLLEKYKKT